MKHIATALLAAALAVSAHAQESADAEEFVVLSPFTVVSGDDHGYKASASLAGSRINSRLLDPAYNPSVNAPVSIVRRADAIAIQFVLSNAGEKQELRNNDLYASVESIEKAVSAQPGLRVEQREVSMAGGNKKVFSSLRGGSPVSFVSLVIFVELKPGVRVVDSVKRVRDLLTKTQLSGITKIADGSVGLYVKSPDQYRREILQKAFEDLEFVRKGIGSEFEVMPNGMTDKVKYRICGDGEVELWIDYSFTISSIRALTKPDKK